MKLINFEDKLNKKVAEENIDIEAVERKYQRLATYVLNFFNRGNGNIEKFVMQNVFLLKIVQSDFELVKNGFVIVPAKTKNILRDMLKEMIINLGI